MTSGAGAATADPVSHHDAEPVLEPAPRGGIGEVLGNADFRRLWLAQLLAQLGEAVALVAMPLLVYGLTGSAELLSLIFVLQLLPRVVFAPVAGILADRLDRRRIVIAADLARAALVALLPFATRSWQIAVVATLVALASTIARPAELAAVPMVVPPGQLVPALSASQVAGSVVRVVGPALAAGIIAATGPRPAFGVQALCFALSAGILAGLVLPPVARDRPVPGSAMGAMRREIVDGLRIVARNPVVRGTALVEALWQLVVAGFVVILLLFVEQTLRLGEKSGTIYSLFMAAIAAGAAAGALVARPVERRMGRPRLMAIGYLGPLMLIPVSLAPPLPALFGCLFLLGFTDAWAVIAMQTYLAEAVPDAQRGRAYASWFAVVTLGGAVAFAITGWITPRLGPPATLALIGILVGAGGPLLLLVTGALRAVRTHPLPDVRCPSPIERL